MKNIFLIDPCLEVADSVYKTDGANIVALIADNITDSKIEIIKKLKIAQYFPRCASEQEFDKLYLSDYNLTYEDIEKYRSLQLKVEHYLHRNLLDIAHIQYKYFTALRFWLGFFTQNPIDMVFCSEIEHGAIWDSMIIEIAKSKNIPVYQLNMSSGISKVRLATLNLLNNKTFINISKVHKPKIDIQQYLTTLKHHYQKKRQNFEHPYKYFYDTRIKTIPKTIRYFFYSPYQKYKKMSDHISSLPRQEIFKSANHVASIKKLYDKLSVNPNYKDIYIYISLHQDPEAATMARPTLTSFLYIIQLISQYIPKEWKIYIKEHPAQFFSYEKTRYFLQNIHYFRTPRFYKTLESLPNVKLIDINTSSNELIQNSVAVVSIAGSALIEAAMLNKPTLVFGQGLTFVELLRDSFTITCVEDLKKALQIIAKNPSKLYFYDDMQDIIDAYVFAIDNTKSMDYTDLFSFIVKSTTIYPNC